MVCVPYTLISDLKRAIQKTEDVLLKHSRVDKVRVLGWLESEMKEVLCNPTPSTGEHCEREGCHPCRSKEGACKKVDVNYKWTCLTCLGAEGRGFCT